MVKRDRASEARFGHVFLICTTDSSADELLTTLQQRPDNDPATEMALAAEEERQISHLRLEKLLHDGSPG